MGQTGVFLLGSLYWRRIRTLYPICTAMLLLLCRSRTIEEVLRTILHESLRLIVGITATSRRLPTVSIQSLNVFDLAKQAIALVRYCLKQEPIDPILVR